MSTAKDLTRWNRAGLRRFRYVDGTAVTFLELLRKALADGFPHWEEVAQVVAASETESQLRQRILEQYHGPRRDWAWEITRVLARASHVLTEHLDAYANEGFLGTATQWDNVRRLVEMIDYHPAPPASASTRLVIEAKAAVTGRLKSGFAVKYSPPDGGAPVVFETLEDLDIDAALNGLRPAEYDRSQERLNGDRILLEGEVEDLKTGEPLVLEDEAGGVLRTYLIVGSRKLPGATEVQVTPRLSQRLRTGYTIVHAKPAERLAPMGPAARGAELERVLRLTEEPTGLLPGKVIWVSDGQKSLYRRVHAVHGKLLVLDTDLGILRIDVAEVSYPVTITVSAQEERPVENPDSVIYSFRVAGDWSRLADRRIAQETVDAGNKKHLPFYAVTAARYRPADSDHPKRGYTILTVSWLKSDHAFPMSNPQTLLVPPVGSGLWRVDTYLEKVNAHLPSAIVTSKPKKTTAGDLAVVVTGHQTSWARLASVSVDLDREEATLTAASSWADRGGSDFFLTQTTVYAHFKEALRCLAWQQNTLALTGNRIPLAAVPSALEKGRVLVVERTGDPTAAFFTTVDRIEGNTLVLARDLPAGFTRGNTLIAGNVALAGHGESRPEKVLGSGDATRLSQNFVFAEAGVSFVADPTQPAGVRAAIDVRVGGRTWQQVGSLDASGPTDPHYTVRMTEAGHLAITFGDGERGRRLPFGVNNVRIGFRSGSGLAGNVPSGSLAKPARPDRLVERVRQPLSATGGNDMEGVESLRENAPATLLTLERAVSLDDFAYLAMGQSSVWQARAFARPTGLGRNEQVEVVVVPAGGGALGPLAVSLTDYLLAHAVPGVQVTVVPYQSRSFSLEVVLSVNADEYNPDEVSAAARTALQQGFSLQGRKLGQDVFLSEVYRVVEGVTGVTHSVAVLDGDPSLRRISAGEREVITLGGLVVSLDGASPAGSMSAAQAPESAGAASRRAVGARGVGVIQGVGARYADLLRRAGIRSLEDLRNLDPAKASIGIPRTRLWEFKTKAELVLGLAADRSRLAPVLDRPLVQLAEGTTVELALLTGQSTIVLDELKGKIRLLQIALDEEIFGSITLRELLSNLG